MAAAHLGLGPITPKVLFFRIKEVGEAKAVLSPDSLLKGVPLENQRERARSYLR